MGGLQTYEWAAAYPDMVARIMPVISSAEADAGLIGWLDIWAMPIRLDPKWNGGDYYGKEPPLAGLAQALKIVTLHAQTNAWATAAFGAKWAKEGESPLKAFVQPLPGRGGARQRRRGARQDVGRQQLPLSRQGQPAVCRGCGRAPQGDQGARRS